MTRIGFFSIVFKPEDAPRLTIRARDRGDLVRLKKHYLPEMSKIDAVSGSDYEFRAYAKRNAVGRALARAATEIDYPNFKDEVFKEQGAARVAIYHRVWAVLFELQPVGRRVLTSIADWAYENARKGIEDGDLRSQELQKDG